MTFVLGSKRSKELSCLKELLSSLRGQWIQRPWKCSPCLRNTQIITMAEAKAWVDFACIKCAPEYRHSWMDTKEGVAYSKGCVVDVVLEGHCVWTEVTERRRGNGIWFWIQFDCKDNRVCWWLSKRQEENKRSQGRHWEYSSGENRQSSTSGSLPIRALGVQQSGQTRMCFVVKCRVAHN